MDYDWDLTRIFKNDDELKSTIDKINDLLKEIIKYKGKIFDNLYGFLETDSKIDLLCERIYIYSFLKFYEDMTNNESKELVNNVLNIYDKANSERSFVIPEILKLDYEDILNKIRNDDRLEKYRFYFEKLFKDKDHVLSEKEEKILSDMSSLYRIPENAFEELDNTDISFDKLKGEEGNLITLTNSNYGVLISSKNRSVRKSAFNKLYKYYKNHINTFSSLYLGHVKCDKLISNTRKYSDSLSMYLSSDNIDKSLYNNLIKCTSDNLSYLYDYYKVKKNVLGLSKYHLYDTYVNISSMPERKYSYSDSLEIIYKALNILGSEYIKDFKTVINNKSVSVLPKKGKRSGAFEWATYGVPPYVCLNFEGDINSISTIAHEMGHAMHSYYSNLNQEYVNANYPIFLAEVASTVNEILLSEYLFNNTDDKNEKIYYLVEFLNKFKSTVYRQTMFAEFEKIVHDMEDNNENLSRDTLCNIYYDLNKKYFGDTVCIDEDIKYEWSRIPHFYSSFYVYKYATGFISAIIIVDNLKKDKNYKEKYLNFLKSGGSKYPLDILKDALVDISDVNVMNRAFEIFNEKLNLLKKYIDE